jgi:hypothetical protein
MKTPTRSWLSFLFLALCVLANPNQLHAQLTRIFVASYGNDANDGSRGSPKRNFQAAHNAVAAGGQIVVLDTAGYGALNITKSLAVTVPPGVNGFVTVTGTNNAITIAAGSGSNVSLRGLIIEGGGSRISTGNSGFGIYLTSAGGSVTVEDCTIRNFLDGLVSATDTATYLLVRNTNVNNCRYGLDVQGPGTSNTGGRYALISGCRLENNGDAIYCTGASVLVEDTVVAGCNTGIHCTNGNGGYVGLSNCRFAAVIFAVVGNSGTNGDNGFVRSFTNNTFYDCNNVIFNATQSLQ